MTHVAFAIPGDIDLPTGGYAYDRRVLALLPSLGVGVEHVPLAAGYPDPSPADLEDTAKRLAPRGKGTALLIDGLAYGAMPRDLFHRLHRPIVALVHHPLCLEAGLAPERAAYLKRTETEALAQARHVIATSRFTAQTLARDFGVPRERITVAEPGTDPAPRARGTSKPVQVLAVGSVIPRKGYDILIDALAPLKALHWRLDIAGALHLSPATVSALRAQIEARGLSDRVRLLGPVDKATLDELYDRADAFVSASHYEGFGMVLTEALARGLAVVCTDGGAAVETLPDDATFRCQAGDVRAMMWTIGRVIEDGGIRKRLQEAAWAAAQSLPRWESTTGIIAGVLKEVTA